MRATAIALAALVSAACPPAFAQYSTAFPPASGGPSQPSGPLATDPCTIFDDGTSENALGLTAGGWLCHIQNIDCLAFVDQVESAFGTAMFPGGISNGRPIQVAVWEDTVGDGNATTGLVLRHSLMGTVTNASTDIFNVYPMPSVSVGAGNAWIGAAVQHSAGEFPAPMDQDQPTPRAWVFGTNTATINLTDPNANGLPPSEMIGLGFPAAWLLRADGGSTAPEPGTPYCFCDPTSAFPSGVCGNPGSVGNGCANGVNPSGANLAGTGNTNPDTVALVATGAVPGQPGLFFQGLTASGGGSGIAFGDGLRCAGQGVIRLQIVTPDGSGTATTSVSISTVGMVIPGSGDVRRYQYWYRNPGTSPCGFNFNLTNGYEITW